MSVQFFCPRWGSELLGWEAFCQKVSCAGYDGFEVGIAQSVIEVELQEIWNAAAKFNLRIIVQHYDVYEVNYSKHYDLYCSWFEKIKGFPCVKINSQTGKSHFSVEENHKLIEVAMSAGIQNSTSIVHETHRNKFSSTPRITKEYLKKIPILKLTLDIAHWICMAGTFLEGQEEEIGLVLDRTEHLHARVGYPCGHQVPDPRLPEWQHIVNRHLNWWDTIIERKKKEKNVLTITPEFAPYTGTAHIPLASRPRCHQWDINVFMMELLRKRYS